MTDPLANNPEPVLSASFDTPEGKLDQPQSEDPAFTVGPGLWESGGWVLLFIGLQVFWTLVVWMIVAASQGLSPQQAVDLDFSELPVNLRLLLVTLPALLGFSVLIPLGCWRMGIAPDWKLEWRSTPLSTWLVALSLMMPLTVVADTLFRVAESSFHDLAQRLDVVDLQSSDVHETLRSLSDASLVLTILMIAVVPAVGEEFLFRGLIGRGLVSRFGLVAGVGLTSLLFAGVHLYPPHVVAILPVGIVLHLVYLATGNFTVPVLFHFLNNSLAAIQIRREGSETEGISGWIAAFCGCYVLLGLFWLWQGNPRNRRNRDLWHIPTPEQSTEAILPPAAQPPTRVSGVATICAILMLLLSAALFAK